MNCNFPNDFYEYESNFSDYNNAEINENIQEMITEMNKQNVNWIKLSMANNISIIIIRTGNTYDITVSTAYYEAEIDEWY